MLLDENIDYINLYINIKISYNKNTIYKNFIILNTIIKVVV